MNRKDSEKKLIDTRTFPEIWKSLNADFEQSELRRCLIANHCCSTPQTIWNWATGKTRPIVVVRRKTAEVVSKFLTGISAHGPVEVKYQTLFPSR